MAKYSPADRYASLISAKDPGVAMHDLMSELFPVCRSITGDGVRRSLAILGNYIPLTLHEVASGTRVFDWTIPKEWNVRDAYVRAPDGKKIIDFQENNLHLVSYSTPVNCTLSLKELEPHLYSLPDQPDAIPYITSYYKEHWGFCLSHRQKEALPDGNYRVVIDSDLKDGSLTYGEIIIPGELSKEIFLSTYVCHPSMANNELSGPLLATALTQWILQRPRKYSYRIIFVPETIGALTYLSKNLKCLQSNVIAGYVLTCLGDERTWSYLPSRSGLTLADRVALCILRHEHPDFSWYSFLDRGSDERQYCSPNVNLPMASIMRSKYREYPEYHTSFDNLDFVTAKGLQESYETLRDCLELIERNSTYKTTCIGEPQLGKYGLYPDVGTKNSHQQVKDTLNILAYADGNHDLIALCQRIEVAPAQALPIIERLIAAGLLEEINTP